MNYRVLVAMVLVLLAGCAGPKPPPRAGGPELTGGGALFHYRNADAKKVYLVGDFNDWSPVSDPMTDENGDGDWTLFYPLGPGRYAYKFVVDGKSWIPDPTNPESEPDGFDGRNSILVIPETTP
jgi:1,4-alpha-glucan branching enzyme